MKMLRFFGEAVTAADYKGLQDGVVQARLVLLLSGYDPERALAAFKRQNDIPFAVRLAACEGIAEYQDRAAKGRTWPLDRWVDEALRTMLREAKRKAA